MNNKNDLSSQQEDYVDNTNPMMIQERLIDELLDSQEKLKKLISDTEELKKSKVLNWVMPILYWNVMFSIVVGILVSVFVVLGILPTSITLPTLGKISTILASLIGINVFVSIGTIGDIDFNYRYFYSKLEEQKINKSKLEIIERKIKSEQKYLEKLKEENNNVIKESNLDELSRLRLLKDYLFKYVKCQYVPKNIFHENDIRECRCEMEKNYPDNMFNKKQKEIEEVKVLLKKRK